MKISLKQTGKRYNYEWIFRNLDFTFHAGNSYAILGANGSGKSTLLQIISGSIVPSAGEINYSLTPNPSTKERGTVSADSLDNFSEEKIIPSENIFRYLSISTPYLELPEEMTLTELLHFHSGFKKFRDNVSVKELIEISGLKKTSDAFIKNFSSGMKQRVKLLLAILSDTPLLLLDEPTTNLDEAGVQWWKNLMLTHTKNRLVIIASNMEREYEQCEERLMIGDYK